MTNHAQWRFVQEIARAEEARERELDAMEAEEGSG